MLDFPATAAALWALFDAGGPRPEYVLPVLYAESSFDPSTPNLAGAPYYGLNQASASLIAAYAGTDVPTYLTWSASAQISTVVSGMYRAIVAQYGPLRSGTRAYQANFLPATLPSARALSDTVSVQGDPYYAANAGLDVGGKGAILVSDLAAFVARAAGKPAVQSAIAATYAERPGDRPHDPVYGEDFGGASLGHFAAAAGFGFLLYAVLRRA